MNKLFRVILGQKEEECLGEDELKKEMSDENKLDAKIDYYFDESDLDSMLE